MEPWNLEQMRWMQRKRRVFERPSCLIKFECCYDRIENRYFMRDVGVLFLCCLASVACAASSSAVRRSFALLLWRVAAIILEPFFLGPIVPKLALPCHSSAALFPLPSPSGPPFASFISCLHSLHALVVSLKIGGSSHSISREKNKSEMWWFLWKELDRKCR